MSKENVRVEFMKGWDCLWKGLEDQDMVSFLSGIRGWFRGSQGLLFIGCWGVFLWRWHSQCM